ncbi:MAG: di-heme enzyme [Bryobacterales bacterium]|nr:di-heme enzyme [Bryobacterales bacterium]
MRLWIAVALFLTLAAVAVMRAHDAHGRSTAPLEARRLRSPLPQDAHHAQAGQAPYQRYCLYCHGEDGRARTPLAGKLPQRPTDLANFLMDSMRDGEIYWVITHGIDTAMPGFAQQLSDTERWQLVQYVRLLRQRQAVIDRSRLGDYQWNLPPGFPLPNVPTPNPMTAAKVELGRHLFYDRRLSANRTQSCASCHLQELAFTDGRARSVGSTGEAHPRSAMSLANVAYSPVLTWANPLLRSLESQMAVPLFGEHPVEMGMAGMEAELLERLRTESRYGPLFTKAYPASPQPFSIEHVIQAIASFQRTILSGDSAYDRYRRGDDPNAVSAAAIRGEKLFFSEELECFHCHGGFAFSGTVDYYEKGFAEVEFHNTGLYHLTGELSYPQPNLGLYEFTRNPDDVGKFKAPTLRNIAVTAPYMHDGSVATLEDAVDHYAAGGRTIATGPHAGDGSRNPNRSEFVKGFTLSVEQKADLIEFLKSLTDETLLTDPALSDPWIPAARSHTGARPRHAVTGKVLRVYAEDGSISMAHGEIPGLMAAMPEPAGMEFLVPDEQTLQQMRAGACLQAQVRRQGMDYLLEHVRILPPMEGAAPCAVGPR